MVVAHLSHPGATKWADFIWEKQADGSWLRVYDLWKPKNAVRDPVTNELSDADYATYLTEGGQAYSALVRDATSSLQATPDLPAWWLQGPQRLLLTTERSSRAAQTVGMAAAACVGPPHEDLPLATTTSLCRC